MIKALMEHHGTRMQMEHLDGLPTQMALVNIFTQTKLAHTVEIHKVIHGLMLQMVLVVVSALLFSKSSIQRQKMGMK